MTNDHDGCCFQNRNQRGPNFKALILLVNCVTLRDVIKSFSTEGHFLKKSIPMTCDILQEDFYDRNGLLEDISDPCYKVWLYQWKSA